MQETLSKKIEADKFDLQEEFKRGYPEKFANQNLPTRTITKNGLM
jgi:hypothetical protein